MGNPDFQGTAGRVAVHASQIPFLVARVAGATLPRGEVPALGANRGIKGDACFTSHTLPMVRWGECRGGTEGASTVGRQIGGRTCRTLPVGQGRLAQNILFTLCIRARVCSCFYFVVYLRQSLLIELSSSHRLQIGVVEPMVCT